MTIRNSTQRSGRRRRVLADDRSETSTQRPRAKRPQGVTRRYPPHDQLVQALPSAERIIPQRPFAVVVSILLLANLIVFHGAVAAFHLWATQEFQMSLEPLALTFERNLATTTIGVACGVASLYAAIVLGLRKHRVDDYRGRYRLWYFVTGLAAGLGMLALSGAGSSLWELGIAALQKQGLTHLAWWNAGVTIVVVMTFIRLAIEVRSSRGTLVTLSASLSMLLLGTLIHTRVVAIPTQILTDAATVLCTLASACAFAFSFALYARHILLDAQGALEAKRPSRQKTQAKAEKPTVEEGAQSDSDESTAAARPSLWRRCFSLIPSRSRRANSDADESSAHSDESKASKSNARAESKQTSKSRTTRAQADREKTAAKSKSNASGGSKQSERQSEPAEPAATGEQERPLTAKLSRAERKRLKKEKRRQQNAA